MKLIPSQQTVCSNLSNLYNKTRENPLSPHSSYLNAIIIRCKCVGANFIKYYSLITRYYGLTISLSEKGQIYYLFSHSAQIGRWVNIVSPLKTDIQAVCVEALTIFDQTGDNFVLK